MSVLEIEPKIDIIPDFVGLDKGHILGISLRDGANDTLVVRIPEKSWSKFDAMTNAIGVTKNELLQSYVIIFMDYYIDYLTNVQMTGKDKTHYIVWLHSIERVAYNNQIEDKGRSIRLNTKIHDSFSTLCNHLKVPQGLFIRYFIEKAIELAETMPIWGDVYEPENDPETLDVLAMVIQSQRDPNKTIHASKKELKKRYIMNVPEDVLDVLNKNAKRWKYRTINHYVTELILEDLCKKGYSVVR